MLKRTYNPRLAEAVWWNLLQLTAGGLLTALCLQCIAAQHGFLSGGVMGMALLAQYWTGLLDAPTWYLVLSAPLFVWGWCHVGRRFLLYTAYGTAVTTAAGLAYAHLGVAVPLQNELYAAVFGGVVHGAGCGLMLRSLGSSGGTDIVGIVLQRRWNIPIGQFSFGFNVALFTVATACGTSLDKMVATLIMLFLSSAVLEYVLGLFNNRKLVLVVSDRGEEIAEAVLVQERFGVTLLRGKGGYSGTDREILLTVTSNIAVKRLEHLVYGIDPHALFIVENTFYVSGGQFARP